MFALILSLCTTISAVGVSWSSPTASRSGDPRNTRIPCGGSAVPPNPLFSYWAGVEYNLTFNVVDQLSPPANLTFYIYRWTPDGNLTKGSAFSWCICDYYQNQTFPQVGPHNITTKFLDTQRCDYSVERCALVAMLTNSDGTTVSTCSDVLVLSNTTDITISITVTLPAGTTPISPTTFQTRLYNLYGVNGLNQPLGFSDANTYIPTTPYEVNNGKYVITFTVSDYLLVTNGQFRAYYSASNASTLLAAEPLNSLSGLATGTSSVSATTGSLRPGGSPGGVGGGGGTTLSSDEKAGKAVAILLMVVGGVFILIVVLLRFCAPELYSKVTSLCNRGGGKE